MKVHEASGLQSRALDHQTLLKGFVTFDCHRHFWSTACRIALVARTTPFSPTVTKMLALTSKLCMHSSFHFILWWQFVVTMNKTLLASTFICNFMFVCSSTACYNCTNFFLFLRGQKSPVVVYSWSRYLRASTVLHLCIAGYLEHCREDCLFVLLLDTEDTLENYWHDSINSHKQQKLCTMSKKAVK